MINISTERIAEVKDEKGCTELINQIYGLSSDDYKNWLSNLSDHELASVISTSSIINQTARLHKELYRNVII